MTDHRNFVKRRRADYLDTLRLPEFTVDLYSSSTYGYDWRRLGPQLPPLARNYVEVPKIILV